MTWVGQSAQSIAAAVRAGKISPREVVEEHLDRIAALNGDLQAFRRVRAEEALAEAAAVARRDDLAELPLAGVPVAVKDNVPVTGEATRSGSVATSDAPATADHPVVVRLRRAGAVVVGLTNLPEFGLVGATEGPFGITRNPWDRDRTPGGSSGGSAAAVASGMVPLAHGNDGLGSIRIPAACCGLVGFKPGLGRVPSEVGEHSWFGLTENGALATTVLDTALALSIMADDPSLAAAADSAEEVRIALAPQPLPPGLTVDKEYKRAVAEAGGILREAGHTVAPLDRRLPTMLGVSTLNTWYACALSEVAGLDKSQIQRQARAFAAAGRRLGRIGLDGAKRRAEWRDEGADRFLGDFDVLVTSTLAHPPPRAEEWSQRGLIRNVMVNARYAPMTGPWNMAGWPALSVPVGRHSSGLPVGVQLVARPGGEALLLGLAAQIEKVLPWPRLAPV